MKTSDAEPVAEKAPSPRLELKHEWNLPSAGLSMAIDAEENRAFVACMDRSVVSVDPDSGAVDELYLHDSYVSGVAWLATSKTLISAGYDGVLKWWDAASKQAVREVNAHDFWSWRMAVSENGRWVASATGQYRCGGYEYEPAPETEPSVKVFSAEDGSLVRAWSHVPPVHCVAFSPDGRYVAAANMMGDVKIWDVGSGDLVAQWNTPDFTSWGIIKSHHYIGGIFDISFSPSGDDVIVCGMGPMRDPMAGNGQQTWQRFAWRRDPVEKVGEIASGDAGRGLMEGLAWHPSGKTFLMAGRMAQGSWNCAAFEADSGSLLYSVNNKCRVTRSIFTPDGRQLWQSAATSQEVKQGGESPDYGRLLIYNVLG